MRKTGWTFVELLCVLGLVLLLFGMVVGGIRGVMQEWGAREVWMVVNGEIELGRELVGNGVREVILKCWWVEGCAWIGVGGNLDESNEDGWQIYEKKRKLMGVKGVVLMQKEMELLRIESEGEEMLLMWGGDEWKLRKENGNGMESVDTLVLERSGEEIHISLMERKMVRVRKGG